MTTTAAPPTLQSKVAANIAATLARRRLTQTDLASRTGHDPQWVSRRLNGKSPITLTHLEEISKALEVTVSSLISEDEEK